MDAVISSAASPGADKTTDAASVLTSDSDLDLDSLLGSEQAGADCGVDGGSAGQTGGPEDGLAARTAEQLRARARGSLRRAHSQRTGTGGARAEQRGEGASSPGSTGRSGGVSGRGRLGARSRSGSRVPSLHKAHTFALTTAKASRGPSEETASSKAKAIGPGVAASPSSGSRAGTKSSASGGSPSKVLLREPVVSESEALRFNSIALATAAPIPQVMNLATIDSASRASALSFYLSGEYDRGVRLACKVCLRYLRRWAAHPLDLEVERHLAPLAAAGSALHGAGHAATIAGRQPMMPHHASSTGASAAAELAAIRRQSVSTLRPTSADTNAESGLPSPTAFMNSPAQRQHGAWHAGPFASPRAPSVSVPQSVGARRASVASVAAGGTPALRVAAGSILQHGAGAGAIPAIVFDVDDTALSSFHAMAQTGFSTVPALHPHFFLATSAPALQPVLKLYRAAKTLGLVTIFVTERPAEARSATLEALNRAGFTGFRYLITRAAGEGNVAARASDRVQATAAEFKYEVRQALYQRGISIVAVVGDQAHDFAGGMAGDFQCKLPNLLYELQ